MKQARRLLLTWWYTQVSQTLSVFVSSLWGWHNCIYFHRNLYYGRNWRFSFKIPVKWKNKIFKKIMIFAGLDPFLSCVTGMEWLAETDLWQACVSLWATIIGLPRKSINRVSTALYFKIVINKTINKKQHYHSWNVRKKSLLQELISFSIGQYAQSKIHQNQAKSAKNWIPLARNEFFVVE